MLHKDMSHWLPGHSYLYSDQNASAHCQSQMSDYRWIYLRGSDTNPTLGRCARCTHVLLPSNSPLAKNMYSTVWHEFRAPFFTWRSSSSPSKKACSDRAYHHFVYSVLYQNNNNSQLFPCFVGGSWSQEPPTDVSLMSSETPFDAFSSYL